MKKYIFLIITIITVSLQAQQDVRDFPKVKEMQERKWQYIVQEAGLTEQEAIKARVIYMEFEEKVWKLMEKNRPFFMNDKKINDDENPDYRKMNEEFVNTEIQKAQYLKTYYMKLRNVLSEEKIFKMGVAERSFRKEMVKDWQGRRRNAKH